MANARIGALRVDLGMNTAAFEKGVGIAERKLNRFAGNMKKVGKRMQSIGKNMTIGLTAPLVAFGYKATQAAIDAEEMESAFDVVFGNMSKGVRKWAEETGNAMGRSTQEIQRGALAFQELFGKALAPEKAAEMSKQFAVLTQDLASFKNLSNEVAQQKLFSGLTGEAEPLRAVGVFINAAAVEAKALELGLEKINGKYTDQQKIVARAAIIQEQLSNAQGDVLRTSESAANKLKTAKAAFEELSIAVGTKLVPALVPLIDKLAAALDWFSNLSPEVQTFAVATLAVGAALGPVVTLVGTLIKVATFGPLVAFASGLTGIGVASGAAATGMTAVGVAVRGVSVALLSLLANPIVLGAAAIIGGIYLAWKNWDKITPYIDAVTDAVVSFWNDNVKPIFDKVLGGIKTVVTAWFDFHQKTLGAVMGAGKAVGSWLGSKISGVWTGLTDNLSRAGSFFIELHVRAFTAMRDLYLGVKKWIVDKLGWVWDKVTDGIDIVKGSFFDLYDAVVGNSYIPDMVDGIADHMGRLDKVMVDKAQKTTAATGKAFRQLASDIRGIMDQVFPDSALIRGYRDDKSKLAQGVAAGIIDQDTADSLQEGLFGNLARGLGRGGGSFNIATNDDQTNLVPKGFADFKDGLNDMAKDAKIKTVAIAKSFADMAKETLSALDSLTSAIKGGGFLDILGAVIDLGLQLGSAGVFGSKIAGSLNGFGGARAAGGPVSFGKSYLVGERGPELFTPGASGSITPNDAMGGGIAHIVPSPYFDVVVNGHIQRAAPTIAQGGAGLAMSQSARMQSRSTR